MDEAAATLVGRQLGEFRLLRPLGEGGFGEVYLARQVPLDREASVKGPPPAVARRSRRRDPPLREARLAPRLDHPLAAHVYAFGTEPDGTIWIAMELVPGITLAELLRKQGTVPLEQLAPFLKALCEVVASAHDESIVHRDIKPSNVMVTSRGDRMVPKLLDLGLATALEPSPRVETRSSRRPRPRSSSLRGSPVIAPAPGCAGRPSTSPRSGGRGAPPITGRMSTPPASSPTNA